VDGADLRLIKKWRSELPFFDQVLSKGFHGELQSTAPPLTIPAWPAMFTGKRPEKLGLADFLMVDKAGRGFKRPDYRWISRQCLWNLLEGERALVWNIPGSYPIEGEDVDFIGGWLPADENGRLLIAPPAFREWLLATVPEASRFMPVHENVKSFRRSPRLVYELESLQARVLGKVVSIRKPRLVISIFRSTDLMLHYAGDEKTLREAYMRVDAALGNLQKAMEGFNLLIVSDHGAEEVSRKFHVNTWLRDKGYLRVAGGGGRVRSSAIAFAARMASILASTPLRSLVLGIKNKVVKCEPVSTVLSRIDWSATRAFAFMSGGGRMYNLYLLDQEVEEELRSELEAVVDPATGAKVVEKVLRAEEVYGTVPKGFPDLVVYLSKGYYTSSELMPIVFYDARGYEHGVDGVIMGYGPELAESGYIGRKDITDIAPTVLHALGKPVGKSMDGRVLKELFREGSEARARRVRYAEYELTSCEAAEPYTAEDEEKIKERLRALGYLD